LDNVAAGRLAWIREAESFSPVKLAETIRLGAETLQTTKFSEGWEITPTIATA